MGHPSTTRRTVAAALCGLVAMLVMASCRDDASASGDRAWPSEADLGSTRRSAEGATTRAFIGEPGGRMFIPDELCGHVHRPDHEQRHQFPEHPRKIILLRSNNLGFREDEDTLLEAPEGTYRILVTGDSHTDGAVFNKESVANRLERMINDRDDLAPTEVINGGVGHYGPHNYVGFLEKHLPLRPDMFVVILYGGNDFLDAVFAADVRGTLDVPEERPARYLERLEAARAVCRPAVAQGLNQMMFFKTYPELEAPTVEEAARQIAIIQRRCSEEGIAFLFLALPTKMDVDWAVDPPRLRATLMKRLGVTDEDMGINRRMVTALLAQLTEAGVTCLDLMQPFLDNEAAGSTDGALYWDQDYHINTLGHRVAARAFFTAFGDRLPAR